jgi:hypothetical protein
VLFHPKCEIQRHSEEKPYPDVSFFKRNIAHFDLSGFFARCNVYSVSTERRILTKIGIREMVEWIVSEWE